MKLTLASALLALVFVNQVAQGTRISLAQRLPEGPSEVVLDPSVSATTTLYPSATRNGRHPIGVITSTADTFINGGTTTEYHTHHLGTYLADAYAKVESTSTREYFRLPTTSGLVGLFSSTTSYEVHGRETTVHTVHHYRTNLDGHYVQLVSTLGKVYSDPPVISATPVYAPEGAVPGDDYKFPLEQSINPSRPLAKDGIPTRRIGARPKPKALKLEHLEEVSEKELLQHQADEEYNPNAIQARSVEATDLDPAPVKPKEALPTFTVEEDGELKLPSASIEDNEVEPTVRHRFDFKEPKIIQPTKTSLDSVTYLGFVDFTTTIDDTVVIFRPKKTFSTQTRKEFLPKIQPTQVSQQRPVVKVTLDPSSESHRTSKPDLSSSNATPVVPSLTSGINPLKSLLAASASRRNLFSKSAAGGNRPRLTLKTSLNPTSAPAPVKVKASVRPGSPSSAPEPNELSGSLESTPSGDVELVFKTMYTTYTYFTTFFRASTTRVKSREEVISNIVTLTNILEASDLASLKSSCEVDSTCLFATSDQPSSKVDVKPTKGFFGRPNSRVVPDIDESPRSSPLDKPEEEEEKLKVHEEVDGIFRTFYTTYTYFTTLLIDGTSSISTRTEIYSNVQSNTGLTATASSSSEVQLVSPTVSPANPRRLEYSSIDRDVQLQKELTTPMADKDADATTEAFTAMTTPEIAPTSASAFEEINVREVSSVTEETPQLVLRDPSEGVTEAPESNLVLEEAESVATPVMKTYYTTFTYFTTLFRNGTSFVTSNLETVTNTMSAATVEPASVQPSVTFFTTFTYWTTSIDGDNTVITSSEETRTDVLPASVTELLNLQPTESADIRFTERPELIQPSAAVDSSSAVEVSATQSPQLESSQEVDDFEDEDFTLSPTVLAASVASSKSSSSSSSSSRVRPSRTFTPVIRPNLFRTRTRPNVRPRGKSRTTVAIITRSEATPTLIATPVSLQPTPTFESSKATSASPLSRSVTRVSSRGSASAAAAASSINPARVSSSSSSSATVRATAEPTSDPSKPRIIPNLRLRRPNPFRARLKERQRLQLQKLRNKNRNNNGNSDEDAAAAAAAPEASTPRPRVPIPRFPVGAPGRTPIFVSSRTETIRNRATDDSNGSGGDEDEDGDAEAGNSAVSVPTSASTDRLRLQRERARNRISSLFKRRRPTNLLRPRPAAAAGSGDGDETLIVGESRRRLKRQVSSYSEFGARTRKRQTYVSRARQPAYFENQDNPPFTAFSHHQYQQQGYQQSPASVAQQQQQQQQQYQGYYGPAPSYPSSSSSSSSSRDVAEHEAPAAAYEPSFYSSSSASRSSSRHNGAAASSSSAAKKSSSSPSSSSSKASISGSKNVRRQIRPDDTSLASTRSRSRFNRNRTRLRSRPRNELTTTTTTQRPRAATRFRNRNTFRRPATVATTPPPLRSSLFDYDYDYDYDVELQSSQNTVPEAITVTHQVPFMTVIQVLENGRNQLRDILTTSPSLEVIAATALKSTNIDDSPVIYANAVTNQESLGTKVITFEALRATETTAIVFTPTRIRGLRTSFSHIIPSTIYNIQPVTTRIVEPIDQSALLNQLLLQLLGGQLPSDPLKANSNLLPNLSNNPQQLLQPAAPVVTPSPTQFITHTSTYVTTITNTDSTVLPITLRGREIKTTLVEEKTEVVTATEFSTETIINQAATAAAAAAAAPVFPTQALFQQPAAIQPTLLPADLQQQLLAAQLQQQLQAQQQQLLNQQLLSQVNLAPSLQQQQPAAATVAPAAPAPPTPITSITTKFVSGKNPGEFSIVTSTVIIEPEEQEHERIRRYAIDASPSRPVASTQAPELASGHEREADADHSLWLDLESSLISASESSGEFIATQRL